MKIASRPSLCTLALLALSSFAREAPAQGELKDIIDRTLQGVQLRQAADGSYGDLRTTAKVLLAYAESPRGYGPSDGPFYRAALHWIEQQVSADGTVRAGDLSAAAAASWAGQALIASRSNELAKKIEQRQPATAAAWKEGEQSELLADTDAAKTDKQLATLLAELQESGARSSTQVGRALAQIVPQVVQLASQKSDAKLDIAGPMHGAHWSAATSTTLLEQTRIESMLTTAPTAVLADFARILEACLRCPPPAPKDGGAKTPATTGTPRGARPGDLMQDYREAARTSLAFLATQQENGRFQFMGEVDAGITALALAAVIRTSQDLGEPMPAYVAGGLDWLKSLQDKDGSIHNGSLKVYVTSASILAFEDAGRPEDHAAIERAAQYLKLTQSDEGEGYDPKEDWAYGGIGYGDDLRPDMSNTQFALEAMRRSGMSEKEEAFAKALAFIQRCQNDPEFNAHEVVRGDGKVVKSGTDGGGVYGPGDSKAGLDKSADGKYVARSYGSMTYALLKSYIFCGVPLEDPRMKAALDWIRANYTLEYNPGFDRERSPGSEYQGLYYYYFTLGKALDAGGIETIDTADGRKHAWRKELAQQLLGAMYSEGFWSNTKNRRWWEEAPVLATSYSLVALDHCLFPRKTGADR